MKSDKWMQGWLLFSKLYVYLMYGNSNGKGNGMYIHLVYPIFLFFPFFFFAFLSSPNYK